MATYQEAYAKTIANINEQLEALQQTVLSLQYDLDLPHELWSQQPTAVNLTPTKIDQKIALYEASQTQLMTLTRLCLFVEHDQLRALTEGWPDFFEKHDLYWWQSAISLLGNPPYLNQKIIATDYDDLAHTSTI